jgi:hypothetical protein
MLIEEHISACAGRRLLAPVEGRHPAGVRVVIEQESAAGHTRALWLDEPEHRLDGHGSIERFAPAAKYLETRIYRQRTRGRDPRLLSAVTVTVEP